MSLRRLQVTDFRCLRSADIELDSQFTLIVGPNASGKTSLLESLYVLGRGRSFRTRRLGSLIRSGADKFLMVGWGGRLESARVLGIEGSAEGMRARLGGERVASLADLAAALPVQIIDPEVHRLIEEGPGRRRRFVDWGVFHVEHGFVERWRSYQQALKQRNAALRARQPRAVVAAWDGELVRLGKSIDEMRTRYIESFAEGAGELVRDLLGMQLRLSFRSGWTRGVELEEALARSWARDQESGVTQVGPQRAELAIYLDGAAVKDRISRGQQKLLAASLLLAQLQKLPREGAVRPLLLLDDPAAELDTDRLLGLIREVSRQALQLVVTSLNPDFTAFGAPGRRYRIDGGAVSAFDG